MKILITGGCGFVGAALASYFKKLGADVIAMDNLVRRGSELNLKKFNLEGITFVHGDVRNPEDLNTLPRVDFIFETSAQPSAIDGYANPVFDLTNNTFGLLNVLEYARRNEAALIFWSTNKVYTASRVNAIPCSDGDTRWVWNDDGNFTERGFSFEHGISDEFSTDGGDHSIYGLSKICADMICQEWFNAFGVRTVVNRFSCLAGEGQFGKTAQGWVAWWAIAFHFGLPLRYIGWEGKQVRDCLFVEDVCRLVEKQVENIDKCSGHVFAVGGGPDITLSLHEATALMEEKFKRRVPIEKEKEARKADHRIYISDIRKAKKMLGWTPQINLDEGYDRIIEWVKANESELKELYL